MDKLKNTYGFTREQIADYKAQFDAFDEDGGGTIAIDELRHVLEKCGMTVTDAQVDEMIKEFDADGNGELDFQEFLGMMHKLSSGPSEVDTRKEMFEFFDENLDGLISLAELQAGWARAVSEAGGKVEAISDAALKALLAEADADGDGFLSEEEFFAVIEACSA